MEEIILLAGTCRRGVSAYSAPRAALRAVALCTRAAARVRAGRVSASGPTHFARGGKVGKTPPDTYGFWTSLFTETFLGLANAFSIPKRCFPQSN